MSAKIKLYTSISPRHDYVGFHEIITAWQAAGFIERLPMPSRGDKGIIAWVGRIGGLVLDPSDIEKTTSDFEYALCCTYRSAWLARKNVLPWNFYSRHWPDYQKVLNESRVPRTVKSIFSGTIRGTIHGRRPQFHERQKWMDSTEIFSWKPAGSYRHSNNLFPEIIDYYRTLSKTRFGLCPMGDVGICQREIETMGLGCVPIFTPGVEYLYAHPVTKGVHFLYAEDPQDMNRQIDAMSESDREQMSKAGMEYFAKHCSPTGLWDTVLETIEKYNISV